MTLTLELSPDLEERLSRRAALAGVPLSKLATEMLEEATRAGDQPKPMTGAELVAQWKAEGVFGAWADRTDIGDSAEYARKLRHEAEHRDWSEYPSPSGTIPENAAPSPVPLYEVEGLGEVGY